MNIDYNLLSDSQLPNNQGHWWSQLSQNQVSTGQEPPQQQQQKEKKKGRGNRKLQRYRKKLRLQALDKDTINKRINNISTNTNVQPDKEDDDMFLVHYENGMEYMVPLNDKVC